MSNEYKPEIDDALVAGVLNGLLINKLDDAKLIRFKVDTRLRTHLAYIFSFVIFLWLTSVIVILFFNNHLLRLNLSDQILIVLLTTTSINVIGMMLMILKNLFPENN